MYGRLELFWNSFIFYSLGENLWFVKFFIIYKIIKMYVFVKDEFWLK